MKRLFLLLLFIVNLFAGERIITLSPSLNEIVFALGSGSDIVANTQYCNYPEASKTIPKLGGYASISLEKLLLAKPSLILTQDYDEALLKNLKKLNLRFHSFKTNNLSSIKTTIKSIGEILNKREKASFILEEIDSSLNSLKGIVKGKRFMVVISPRTDLNKTIYIAGNNLYFNDIIEASGNKNAYQSLSLAQPVVNVEKIINMNPDVIVLLAPYIHQNGISHKELKDIWRALPINASQEDNIYIIDKEYAGIPSNRVVNFIGDFKKILEHVSTK